MLSPMLSYHIVRLVMHIDESKLRFARIIENTISDIVVMYLRQFRKINDQLFICFYGVWRSSKLRTAFPKLFPSHATITYGSEYPDWNPYRDQCFGSRTLMPY